ncbi:MAG: chloride channel protein, partial [Opitutaceae bacterium]|nr:chloride channel protein [Opitutaceae bacterium]
METGNRSMYRKSRRWMAGLLEKITLKQQRQFYLLAALIGLTSGVSAVAFHRSINWAENNFIQTVNELSGIWLYVFLLGAPTLGGLVVGFLIRYWAPEAAGSGMPQTKAAYFIKFGRIRFRTAVSKYILGTVSIGSGASLGREGPTVQISAALASWVGRWLGLAPKLVMRLIPLGAAGGIA